MGELLFGAILLFLVPVIRVANMEKVWRYTIAILLIVPLSVIALLIFEKNPLKNQSVS
jgi:hypothetical protein